MTKQNGGRHVQIGYHTICWGGVVGAASGVTSIKDLYYQTAGSVEVALHEIASAGYAGIEVFDGDLVEAPSGAEWWSDLLARTGLKLVAVYCGASFIYVDALSDELARIELAAEAAAALGASQLVVGGGARRATGTTESDYACLASALDTVTQLAKRHGLRASYHPHLGTMAETPDEIDEVFSRSSIDFCPDTAHLAAAGGDPVELIQRYADRVAHVHLKDIALDRGVFLPLGAGSIDFPAAIAELETANFNGWAIIELDTFDGDPADAARASGRYLRPLLSGTAGEDAAWGRQA